jgi:RimJ/RimL family protein N-acetyltransferase
VQAYAYIDQGNVASASMAERVGFQPDITAMLSTKDRDTVKWVLDLG